MSSINIDYVDTYFEFPSLTRIQGEPTYKFLKKVKDELPANITSIITVLGGGVHIHLRLVLSAVDYALVLIEPYTRPTHPGTLVIPPGTAQHEVSRLHNDHKDAICLFHETIDVEKALLKKLVTTLEPEYLKSQRNKHTNAIKHPFDKVLDHLFENMALWLPVSLMILKQGLKRQNTPLPILSSLFSITSKTSSCRSSSRCTVFGYAEGSNWSTYYQEYQ